MTKQHVVNILRDDMEWPAWEWGHIVLALHEEELRGGKGSLWWHSLLRVASAIGTEHLEWEIDQLERLCR